MKSLTRKELGAGNIVVSMKDGVSTFCALDVPLDSLLKELKNLRMDVEKLKMKK